MADFHQGESLPAKNISREEATFRVRKFFGPELANAWEMILRHPASSARHGVTAEGLLSALFKMHRERVSGLFENPDPLDRLVDDYLPERTVPVERGTHVSGTIAGWEPGLLDLLWFSARIARALNQTAVGIEHFVCALALDPIVSERLDSKGLQLKGHLPPLAGDNRS
jgi:hypothetical protein